MHLAHLDWLNEECEKKLKLQADEFNATLGKLKRRLKLIKLNILLFLQIV
jgi:hypothetical protein